MKQEEEPDVWGGTCQWVAENGVWVLQASNCPPGSTCTAPQSPPAYDGEKATSGCAFIPSPSPSPDIDVDDDMCDPE